MWAKSRDPVKIDDDASGLKADGVKYVFTRPLVAKANTLMTLAPDTTYSAYMSWAVTGKTSWDKGVVRGVKAADGTWGQTKNMKIQEVPSVLKAKQAKLNAGNGFIPGLSMPISIVVVVVIVVVLAALMAIICCCCCMKKDDSDAGNKVTALD